MGMSASQAKLLSITSRIHDIEFKAQAIQDAKLQLATQKDDLYDNYCEKLDAKKIQIAVGTNGTSRTYVDATFATVCTYDENRQQQYAIRKADSNKIIVSNDVYDTYVNKGFSHDKYAFAWAMLGLDENFGWETGEGYGPRQGAYVGIDIDETGGSWEDVIASGGKAASKIMTDVEQKVYDKHSDDPILTGYYDEFNNVKHDDDYFKKREAFDAFRNYLYSTYGGEIYKYMILDKSSADNTEIGGQTEKVFAKKDWSDIENEFNYYTQLFDEIKNGGGCISINEFCEDGNPNNEWFNSMVNTGQILIDMWMPLKKEWVETSVATCTTNNYLQEVSDTADLKKAEAEYEHDLDIINSKDKKFDNNLNDLETERNALKTEMESVKKVKDENIERTFGIFS